VTAKRSRTVYSTDRGGLCATCGWPLADCRCSVHLDQPVPDRITARLRLERKGRKGKTVTLVDGLPRNTPFLKELASELKRACGSGGTATEETVEIQGDHRDRLRELLAEKGWTVRG
jgi:translation initiation factor 1